MTKIDISYKGGLRTTCVHTPSSEKIITDAPVDNNGKGAYFSPTDLLASAYLSCMFTIIGIYCDQHQLEFKKGEGSVEKHMLSNPRRVGQLDLTLNLSGNKWSDAEQKRIINAAKNCPVAKSVSPDIIINLDFIF
jgi:uncharacterized OsmC-like protein